MRIEDYAMIGNNRTAALVGRNGSIDWLCAPRFDAPACFAALLGTPDHGRWLLAPRGAVRRIERRYRDRTLVLETDFHAAGGAVRIVDCMPGWEERTDVVRIVEGLRGRVRMHMELVIRGGYGVIVPWVRRVDGALLATAGPESLELRSDVPVHGKGFTTVASFSVARGERVAFVLTHFPSHLPRPMPIDPDAAVDASARSWRAWSDRCTYDGRWREPVMRSLITLKALTYAPTGGIAAAVTTSLPEAIGGVRNWDYRYCWPRDATSTLYAFLLAGYRDEARGSTRTPTPGISSGRCCTTWEPTGPGPTTASGKCAGRDGTTRIPRSWPGSPSIGRSRQSSNMVCPDRSSAGAPFVPGSMRRSAARATTPHARLSSNTMARPRSMRACCCCRSSVFCRSTIPGCGARWRQSAATSWSTGWLRATVTCPTSTGCRRAKAFSCRAHSGSPIT